ncbi:MAG: imidazoleglycerol-phosphate dehydratase HisB [Firmicutes bacterium]|nr:imidazoleglycerol-phosphate dehydratase HisB [Bacillota bacterium]
MRTAQIVRKTKETDIELSLCLDGGEVSVDTGIGFFDHMLTAFAMHGGYGLTLKVRGDLNVDCHHTVEDTGIALGKAFAQALGDKSGICRYGSFYVPMDEALAFCASDFSGRGFLVFRAEFAQERVGGFDTCMTEEFFRALAINAGLTLHISVPYGSNAHHQIEAIFKAAGHALAQGTAKNTTGAVLSTKGML